MNLNDPNIIDFSQFKKKQENEKVDPLFQEPSVITLAAPNEEETEVKYLVLLNVVINGRQFLALEELGSVEPEIFLVEALVEEGTFAGVQMVQSEEEYNMLLDITRDALNVAITKGEDTDDENN